MYDVSNYLRAGILFTTIKGYFLCLIESLFYFSRISH
jgi:hypothetical protein